MLVMYRVYGIITLLAEVPGFARGIPRTIKYKCAIIAHHERKAGGMPIIIHHERKAREMPIIAHHERKAREMSIIAHHEEKPEKCQFRPL